MNKNKNNQTIWNVRIKKNTSTLFKKVGSSIDIDKKLYKEDITASIVHVEMLFRQKIISFKIKNKIVYGLSKIEKEIIKKKFEYNKFTFLARDAHRFIKKSDYYDIIFADPPYELYELDVFIENALKKLNKNGILIIECSSKESLEGYDKIAKFGETNLLYWKV